MESLPIVMSAEGLKFVIAGMIRLRTFYADMGPMPEAGCQLDRVDNDGDYEPGNCRWVSIKQNNRNKSDNRILESRGESMCLIEWAEKLGVPRYLLSERLRRGWSVDKALWTPWKKYKKTLEKVLN